MISKQDQEKAIKHNQIIQIELKLLLYCLKILALNLNLFIMRDEFVINYALVWSKRLLVEEGLFKTEILVYLCILSRFMTPFNSLLDDQGQQRLQVSEL